MSTQIQWRRGTTAQHSVFTGALGEVTVDTDKDTLVVHDNSTVGGFPLARESALNTHIDRTDNPHEVTKIQVGLEFAENTADIDKVVASAGKLTAAVNISLSGDASGSISFDGSGDADIVVSIDNDGHTHAFGNITNKPTTLAGYSIGDAYTKTEVDAGQLDNRYYTETEVDTLYSTAVKLTGNQTIGGIKTFSSNVVGSITGNSATATKLATAITINGGTFDGSADISVGLDAQSAVFTTALTLNATHKNKVLLYSGTFNIALPTVGTIKSGDLFIIDNIGTGTLSLVTNGNNTDLSRLTVLAGEVLILQSDGGNFYRFVSRSKDFASSINTNGYTYLPNGLILQWGTSTGVAIANSYQIITTPIVFPTACLSACGSSGYLNSYGGAGKSGAKDVAVWGNNIGVVINYIAIGY